MKRPAFQFYPADWRNNAKLRRCSVEARGAWVEVLCLLHDSDEYGVLRWPLDEIAHAAGVKVKLLQELSAKDVLKGADKHAEDYVWAPSHAGKIGDEVALVKADGGPCWYSSRFVRDEHVRQRRGALTRFTEDSQPPKPAPKPAPKRQPKVGNGGRQGDGASSSSSTTEAKSPPTPRAGGLTFAAWIDGLPDGEDAIPKGHHVFAYAERVGIPPGFLELAWVAFERRYRGVAKRYSDWPQTFRNAVEGNWAKLWWIDNSGAYQLTTVGRQLERELNSGAA